MVLLILGLIISATGATAQLDKQIELCTLSNFKHNYSFARTHTMPNKHIKETTIDCKEMKKLDDKNKAMAAVRHLYN